ncbi:MAG: CRISPR-associated endonuclease Cas2 [Paramuribaculum sp.]|nr:CRISPR-associated endonuclease Cas2 [Paramuribaculum sp.]
MSRYNQYKIMWTLVLFDLPTETKLQRKAAARFRKDLVADGFSMFQFSIYIRHSPSRENSDVHVKRVMRSLPNDGHVCIIRLTDKQFNDILVFNQTGIIEPPRESFQLELF